ncbi:hypothetical protein KAR91_02230 [Candidatus Pacearchaeota archaeon]|nr:hypothetical protein [Candidatus Pacearchaeota archaeon]
MTGNGGIDIIIKPENAVYQALDTLGTGLGSISQNVNGSVTPVKFFIQPPSDEKYILQRMALHAIDSNWNNANFYGATAALLNGIRIYIENDGGIIKEYTSNFKIKRTRDWALLAGADAITQGAAGADPLIVRWTFNAGATNIPLDGSKNERFVLEIPDDLTGLDDQIAVVQGGKRKIS